MAYRTDELARAAAFVWDAGRREGVEYVTKRHPPGSFQEAMEIAALAKKSGRPAGTEGRGWLVKAASARELEPLVRGQKGPTGEAKD
jgi:hypothetical protein